MNVIIAHQKFQESVVELINNSGLPAFIMKQTLKDIVQLLDQLEEHQLQEAARAEKEAAEEEKQEKKEGQEAG